MKLLTQIKIDREKQISHKVSKILKIQISDQNYIEF